MATKMATDEFAGTVEALWPAACREIKGLMDESLDKTKVLNNARAQLEVFRNDKWVLGYIVICILYGKVPQYDSNSTQTAPMFVTELRAWAQTDVDTYVRAFSAGYPVEMPLPVSRAWRARLRRAGRLSGRGESASRIPQQVVKIGGGHGLRL